MATEIELSMSVMFRNAVEQSTVYELRKSEDWDAFNAIKRDGAQREKAEIAHFAENREALIAEEKKKLIDEAGSHTFEHPTPFGTDRFNPNDIAREAESRVERAHQSRLMKINEDVAQNCVDLTERIRAREGVRDLARDAFTRATDRRAGQDRRGPAMD